MKVQEILKNRVESSDLIEIELPKTKSQIVQENKDMIYCSVYKGLRGLFRKDVEETRKFGRKICDAVKEKLDNDGFFTTDELPNYGVGGEEKETILKETKAEKDDLVAVFVYDEDEARKTKNLLDKLLRRACNSVVSVEENRK